MEQALIDNSIGILFILAGNCAFWFFLEKFTGWKLFGYFPPLVFIYAMPAIFSNVGIIPGDSGVYDWMGANLLPVILALLLLDVDIRATVKVMGKGIFVMLLGSLGIIIGAPIGYFLVKGWLEPEAWKGFGALAGSWIGGTGNMAAVAEGLKTSGTYFGLAVIADNLVYLIWLPILLQSKNLAKYFNRFTGVSEERLNNIKVASDKLIIDKGKPAVHDILYLLALSLGVAYFSGLLAGFIPQFPPVLSTSTYKILIVTTLGIMLSFSPARKIAGSQELAMALLYLFVARMGAKAVVSGLAGQAIPFVAGAYIWIFIHGLFILVAARIFHIDIHTAAISSAANIGGVASSPIVAAYHDERLVPVSILMALVGYAVGTYGAFLAAWLCSLVAG